MGSQLGYGVEETADVGKGSVEENEIEEIATGRLQGNVILLPHQVMALCGGWWSVGIKKNRQPALELPWLMLPTRHDADQWCHDMVDELDGEDDYPCSFFTPSDGRVHKLLIPELHRRHWRGSSHGWLITVQAIGNLAGNVREDCRVTLFNPLTRGEIELPPQKRCPIPIVLDKEDIGRLRSTRSSPYFFRKAILSHDPAEEGCTVVAITSFHHLAFCAVDDDRWSVFDGQYDIYEDIIFFKGKLHAVNASGRLSTFELAPCPRWKNLDVPYWGFDVGFGKHCKKYLVGCGDQLLLVLRYFRDKRSSETVGFEVFRWEEGNPEWAEVKDLGGWMVFLGISCSQAYPAELFPSKGGFRGGCIYYAGDTGVRQCMDARVPFTMHDIGMYSLKEGITEAFFSPEGEEDEDQEELVYPPIWVSPNPWWGSLQQHVDH